jgi:hypothetical protein
MKTFTCHCGNRLHFENTRCLACGRTLGFAPQRLRLLAFEPVAGGLWRSLDADAPSGDYRMCNNYSEERVCNWMVPADDPDPFCFSCRLNQIIPNLNEPKNHLLWLRIERAKRRLLYSLYELKLPVVGRDVDPEGGLSFAFLADHEGGHEFSNDMGHQQQVMTGHDTGLITINIAEADTSVREEIREQMGESYRTLLGHFRHEVAHYYWDRLIPGSEWLDAFRGLFGDEQADYSQALDTYYAEGAPADWQHSFISAYATSHPWEDWAETWAHYLHMVDTLDTAHDFGFAIEGRTLRAPTVEPEPLPSTAHFISTHYLMTVTFDEIMDDWTRLTLVMNALNRSMGQRDAYPFALSPRAAEKLRFVYTVISHQAKSVR